MSNDYSPNGRLRSPNARIIHLGVTLSGAAIPEPGWSPMGVHSVGRDLLTETNMVTSADSFHEWGEFSKDNTLHVTVEYDVDRNRAASGWTNNVAVDIRAARARLAKMLHPWERLIDHATVTDARDWTRNVHVYLANEEHVPLIVEARPPESVETVPHIEKFHPHVTRVVKTYGTYDVSTARMPDGALETVIVDLNGDIERYANMGRCFADETAMELHRDAVQMLVNSYIEPTLTWR